MCSIYVINVGANTNHSSKARSPIFNDGSFVFVSFFADQNETHRTCYPEKMIPFTNQRKQNLKTHSDPNWEKKELTYGDDCSKPRAAALKNVKCGDIFLFWGLLWRNSGKSWGAFVSPLDKGWYLFGAFRIEDIVKGRKKVTEAHPRNRLRVQHNIHCSSGVLPDEEYVFLGDQKYSKRFSEAIDLGVYDPNGLVYKAFTSADGNLLRFKGKPDWFRSLRACRKMWDLNKTKEHQLAEHVRYAIRCKNPHFDLLKDM